MENENRYSINAVERSFLILDMLSSDDKELSIQEVSQRLGVSSNMAFRLLVSLEQTGYIQKNPKTGLYSLSVRILKLSRCVLQSLEIHKFAMPYLELLWSNFQKANINLGMKYGDDILMIDRVDGKELPRTYFTPGKELPFYCTGLGKVLCSGMSEEEVLALIKRTGPLKSFTHDTITDSQKIIEELQRVRSEGVGRDRNEYIQDSNCSAVPVYDASGSIVAAISASALVQAMPEHEIEATIPRLKDTAGRISSLLGYRAG